jgi:hypothetical protein
MAQVVTRCRMSGHYMFMGIDTSREVFANLPDPFARRFCPYCACEHSWYKSDAKFEKAGPVFKPRIQQAS